VTLSRNPTAGLSAFAVTLWFKTDRPELDTKLATAAIVARRCGHRLDHRHQVFGILERRRQAHYRGPMLPLHHAATWRVEPPAVSYNGNRLQEYINGDLAMDCETTRRRWARAGRWKWAAGAACPASTTPACSMSSGSTGGRSRRPKWWCS